MAERTKFRINNCGECQMSFPVDSMAWECRLNPPVPITQYASAYPVVRNTNPACFQGIARPKLKGKK